MICQDLKIAALFFFLENFWKLCSDKTIHKEVHFKSTVAGSHRIACKKTKTKKTTAGFRLTNSLQTNPILALKIYCQDLKTHSGKLVMERCGYFCSWPNCTCICRNFL